MANLTNVIKISQTDYNTLAGGGTITKGGVTYSFDSNAMYLIEDDGWQTFTFSSSSYEPVIPQGTYVMAWLNNSSRFIQFGAVAHLGVGSYTYAFGAETISNSYYRLEIRTSNNKLHIYFKDNSTALTYGTLYYRKLF